MDHLKRKDRSPKSGINTSKRAAFMESREVDDTILLIDDVDSEKNKCRYQPPTLYASLMKERQNTLSRNSNIGNESPMVDNSKYSNVCLSPSNVDATYLGIAPMKLNTSQLQAFTIRVDAEILLISIESKKIDEYTIKWLAEKASSRYYDEVGLKPILHLETADGFVFHEEDTLSVAAGQNLLVGKVDECEIASLAERYKEMCAKMNEDIYEPILPALEGAKATNKLEIIKWLTYKQLKPVFKALLHQKQLQLLDLSYNMFGTEGWEEFIKILPTLVDLKVLKLCGNHISAEDLKKILLNGEMEKMKVLQIIDFSHNDFGDEGVKVIAEYCQTTAAQNSLCGLRLSCCHIKQLPTNLFNLPLKLFDISYNMLTNNTLKQMFLHLKKPYLKHLNLNYAFNPENNYATEILTDEFEAKSFPNLSTLGLAGLKLDDCTLYIILSSLNSKSFNFEILDISDNTLLTTISLHWIHEKLLRLNKLISEKNKNLLSGENALNILREWSNQNNFPDFMILELPSNESNADKDADAGDNCNTILAMEIKILWEEKWELGAFVKNDDTLVLYTDKMDYVFYLLVGKVDECKISSLAERYKEMGAKMNEDIYEPILPALEGAKATKKSEKIKWLTYKQLKPIFKALLHQKQLQFLDLSYNMFGTEGWEEFIKILPTLVDLKVLKLCGNHISAEDLKKILLNGEMEKMKVLQIIDFSHNDFGDEGVKVIAEYCQTTAAQNSLCGLRLSCCHIKQLPTNLFNLPLKLFDISYNMLTNNALKQMFLHLKKPYLKHLNLNYAFNPENNYATEILADEFEAKSFPNLSTLGLAGLELDDCTLYIILSSLNTKSYNFEILDISDNTLLTTMSLHWIHEKLLRLNKLISEKNKNLLSSENALNILREWSNQNNFPDFMILELPSNDSNDDKDEDAGDNCNTNLAIEIKTLWEEKWELGAFVKNDDTLVLYTDNMDYVFYTTMPVN